MGAHASTSVTIEKEHSSALSTVSIDLSVSGTEFGIYIRDDEIVTDLIPSPECAAVYTDSKQLYRACLAGANEGVICTSRTFRELCGRVAYTRLRGLWLPASCATAYEIAASLALLRILSRPEKLKRSMDGWRIVT